jgi:DNA polymerase III delta prime subunit
MKYYETLFEDYLNSSELYNIHPELNNEISKLPINIKDMPNLLIYGPTGIGKYTQVLRIIKKYSPSELKYDKKITINTDKQQYIYHISDIHYEIDMSLLGCNSKTLWHELFFQLVDIISVKQNKVGIILCKNFHSINSELLEVFYSYIQQYNTKNSNITIKFIILSENISFLPYKIINSCYKLGIKRPSKESYTELLRVNYEKTKHKPNTVNNITRGEEILKNIDEKGITNMKEIRTLLHMKPSNNLPDDLFNKVCDNIINKIENIDNIKFTEFRDCLYEILTYDIEINECLWYIIYYFISDNKLSNNDVSDILIKCYTFFKYFNNNYRPIYHLENIMFYIIKKIYNYDELPKSMRNP